MSTLKSKLNLLWLAEKGLVRFRFWFFLKFMIIIIWGLLIFNLIILQDMKMLSLKNDLNSWLLYSLFAVINFLTIIIFLITTSFTFRLRKNEFGLYRCSGASRREIFLLVINEGFILSLLSVVVIGVIQAGLIIYYHVDLMQLFHLKINFSFIFQLIKGLFFSGLLILTGLTLCYIPFALYYAYKDPYSIIRY